MTRTAAPAEVVAARRALTNFRAMVRRPNNWEGALASGYQAAYAGVLRAEDVHGVDVAAPLADRLTALRHESGLSPADVIDAERAATASVDRAAR